MNLRDVKDSEYHNYYQNYILRLKDTSILDALRNTEDKFVRQIDGLSQEKLSYRYAEGKWTVAEVIQHLIDSERIFTTRVLRIARNDSTELPGFEQDTYVPFSGANSRSVAVLISDFKAVRLGTISLFTSFTDEMLIRQGWVGGSLMSVRAIGFIVAGHLDHHLSVLIEKYGV
ncbi:DinB family protein [Sinomicrobium sp.]